jgi:polysaccharide pyruvyl transferase WcaK-like protein
MNKVLFCGAGYGAGNIGDDAILVGLLASARKYLREDTQYGALTFNPVFTKQTVSIDQVFNFETDVDRAFDWATHIVLGGASLLSGWSIPYCSGLIDKAHVKDKPICMLAAGTSVQPDAYQLELLRTRFDSLDMITLRSEKDRELAIEYGLNSAKLFVCADGAFAVDFSSVECKSNISLGVNLVNESLIYKHAFLATFTKFLTTFDEQVLFICEETRQDFSYDYVILNGLHNIFKSSFSCEYLSCFDFVNVLAQCKIIVTMRMHIMIFCALVGIPCIPLIREPKMSLMADSLGLHYRLGLDDNDFSDVIYYVLKYKDMGLAKADNVFTLKDRTLQNGEFLCRWMRKEL